MTCIKQHGDFVVHLISVVVPPQQTYMININH